MPIGQNVLNSSGVVGSIGGVVGGLAGTLVGGAVAGPGGAIAGAAATLASATNLALSSNQKTPSISGGIGSDVLMGEDTPIYTEFAIKTMDPTAADYINTKGRPLGEVYQISSIPGYVECVDAHVDMGGTAEEKAAVDAFLNAGIYYE